MLMIQISKIAKELGVQSSVVLYFLKSKGFNVAGVMSKVDQKTYNFVLKHFTKAVEIIPSIGTPTEISYKHNIDKFIKIISKHGITGLYHFTDESNLDSIKRHKGLYSWQKCLDNGIKINKQASNELSRDLDKKKGLENYVRLSFTKDHPMMHVAVSNGAIDKPKILKIDVDVLYWLETKYSDVNAAANYANIGGELTHLKNIDFKIIKSGKWKNEDEKHKLQAEILVKEHIPIKYIKNI